MTTAGFAKLLSGLVRMALLLACGLALSAAPAAAAPDTGAGAESPVHLAGCIAAQRPGDTAVSVLADPARFDCRTPEWRLGSGNYWVWLRLPAVGGTQSLPRELSFVPQWQQAMSVFVRNAAGRITSASYPDRELGEHIRIGATFRVALAGGEQPATDVLFKIDGALNASGLLGDPHIALHEQTDDEELIATAIFAAFAGLGIGLFCYNIVLWLTIRERFQLTYCLSLLAMLAYAWTSSGAMAEQFPLLPNTTRLATSYVMLAFVAALALQFISDFIEEDKIPARLRAGARQLGMASVLAALAVVLAPLEWRHAADRIYVISFIPLPVMVMAMTLVAWRRGSRSIRVLAIAWALPTAMAVVRIGHSLHLIDYGLLVQYALVGAMSIEALLSSLAMSFRIKLITDERDRALIDERAARHLASVDSLTGLLNRRALLEQVIDWSSPEPLRLLIVDIDRFKLINDRHGHLVGDEVLREVAEVLAIRADLRASVARLGGEEFALIGTAEELHEGIALGILADIRARPMAGDVQVTVSVGMAEGMVRCEDEWRELYRRADAALYRAKDEGRNRAVHADPAADPAITDTAMWARA
jgi:diguanylate cyclase (GGDEF)-like protein